MVVVFDKVSRVRAWKQDSTESGDIDNSKGHSPSPTATPLVEPHFQIHLGRCIRGRGTVISIYSATLPMAMRSRNPKNSSWT